MPCSRIFSGDKFDCIQIYRGGLDILRIEMTKNKCGRSAYIEINDYRRRLAQFFADKSKNAWA
jgi:hypothetical protein